MPQSVRVLVVEDEVALAGVVRDYLLRDGYTVEVAHDGPAAVEAARRVDPDLVVLDLMLPGFDGIEVCRRLREFTDAYVLMLTARDAESDKVAALSTGADDYVVKPVSPRELLARASAMLRRPRSAGSAGPAAGTAGTGGTAPPLVVGGLEVDVDARTVAVDGTAVELTRTEFDLLAAMAASPRTAFTRAQLIEAVWGGPWYGDEHVVDVHVGPLRRKLADDAAQPRFVRTVRGVGYGMGPG
ncbi:MAG: response regulator transcription factor [Actinobacteria bacterium]|nr:response regulator transcription factor [Actinomycetota bacterium]